jgi:hypothetical protein
VSSEEEQLRAPTTDVDDRASAAHILSALDKVSFSLLLDDLN